MRKLSKKAQEKRTQLRSEQGILRLVFFSSTALLAAFAVQDLVHIMRFGSYADIADSKWLYWLYLFGILSFPLYEEVIRWSTDLPAKEELMSVCVEKHAAVWVSSCAILAALYVAGLVPLMPRFVAPVAFISSGVVAAFYLSRWLRGVRDRLELIDE